MIPVLQIRQRQDMILKGIKMLEGISIRQIARITGLSQMRVESGLDSLGATITKVQEIRTP